MDIIQRLRAIGKTILVQLELHGQLIQVEWAIEKHRLQQSLIMLLLAFSCFFGFILTISLLLLTLAWPTEYRIHTIVSLIGIYAVGLFVCCYRLNKLIALSGLAFAETRNEIAAECQLIRNQL